MSRWTKIGIIGSIITALCCFTPLLVFAFAAIGLSAAIPYVDIALLRALAGFILLTLFAFWKQNQRG